MPTMDEVNVEPALDMEVSDTEEDIEDTTNNKNRTPEVYTLKVLAVIKDAQKKHGLRHGDYQRYRSYCSRRIRRIRKMLHFMQGTKKNFRKKEVTEEVLTNEKYLYIPLMNVERAWSYSMQLKQESNSEPRKRFHLASRLRKAAKLATAFQELCDQSTRCDARTKLEAQAYAGFIRGNLSFELRQWKDAMQSFTQSQTIYENLSSALSEGEADLYKSRAEELVPSIRFCAYSIGDRSVEEELLKMRPGQNQMLDILLSETRSRQAEALSQVNWRGRVVGVQQEKVRTFLLSLQEFESALETSADRLEIYETFLMDCKDAMNVLREELRQDPAYKMYQPDGGLPVSSQHYLYTYLSYIRLTYTVRRNLLIIDNTRTTLQAKQKGADGRRSRLQDLIRLYEIILQNLQDIPQLAGLEGDQEIRSSTQAQIMAYKGFRCYYVAQGYAGAQRWSEATGLYERVEEYCRSALQTALQPDLKVKVEELLSQVSAGKFSVHARSILSSEDLVENTGKLQLNSSKVKTLDRRLNVYNDDVAVAENIVQFPPAMEPIPCKPLFFDLALNRLQLPDLTPEAGQQKQAPPTGDAAANQTSGGLTGLVRGLWGWGSK